MWSLWKLRENVFSQLSFFIFFFVIQVNSLSNYDKNTSADISHVTKYVLSYLRLENQSFRIPRLNLDTINRHPSATLRVSYVSIYMIYRLQTHLTTHNPRTGADNTAFLRVSSPFEKHREGTCPRRRFPRNPKVMRAPVDRRTSRDKLLPYTHLLFVINRGSACRNNGRG